MINEFISWKRSQTPDTQLNLFLRNYFNGKHDRQVLIEIATEIFGLAAICLELKLQIQNKEGKSNGQANQKDRERKHEGRKSFKKVREDGQKARQEDGKV